MSVLSRASQKQVEDELVAHAAISKDQLEKLRSEAEKQGSSLISLLISSGQVDDETLTKTIARVAKVPYVNLGNARIEPEVLDLLSQEIAERYMAVPLGEMQNRLVVAMLDADNVQAVDFLSNKIGRPLKVYAASESGIRQVLKQYDANLSKQVANDISSLGVSGDVAEGGEVSLKDQQVAPGQAKNFKTIVQDSPVSKALTAILEYAAKNGASDIHIEPMIDALKVRCRVDGILREILRLPKSAEPPLISRVKILANLKIDEHRVPQDGEFSIRAAGRDVDLRIAISPVVWGEQVVIRLLDKTSTSLKLEDMGYAGRALRAIREGIKGTSGMVLTSGPTGSGKSTSLYALLQEVKSDAINIVTLEDPVEYKMGGINQIQVNPEVGLTFANGLRSILRQDPDVVMVGEIRDKETAELAVQASLTGHLVFSTLHTNSAAGILPRLLDMGIEPFLIASTVRTVIGQRLVRRVATNAQEYQSDKVETEAIHKTVGHLLPKTKQEIEKISADLGYQSLPVATQNAYTLYKGQDSPDTPGGYKGRMGIYEVFNITPKIQELVLKRSTSADIQKVAQSEGMVTMREDGYLKTLNGQTTISEVNRVASADSA